MCFYVILCPQSACPYSSRVLSHSMIFYVNYSETHCHTMESTAHDSKSSGIFKGQEEKYSKQRSENTHSKSNEIIACKFNIIRIESLIWEKLFLLIKCLFFEYRRKIKQTVNATRKNTLIKALIEVTISHVIKVCVFSNNDGYARLKRKTEMSKQLFNCVLGRPMEYKLEHFFSFPNLNIIPYKNTLNTTVFGRLLKKEEGFLAALRTTKVLLCLLIIKKYNCDYSLRSLCPCLAYSFPECLSIPNI